MGITLGGGGGGGKFYEIYFKYLGFPGFLLFLSKYISAKVTIAFRLFIFSSTFHTMVNRSSHHMTYQEVI